MYIPDLGGVLLRRGRQTLTVWLVALSLPCTPAAAPVFRGNFKATLTIESSSLPNELLSYRKDCTANVCDLGGRKGLLTICKDLRHRVYSPRSVWEFGRTRWSALVIDRRYKL